MRILQRAALIIFILLIIGFIFRGWLYRHLITYRSIALRANYSATDRNLVRYIHGSAEDLADPDIERIIKRALSMTSKQLNFTADHNDADPNKLIHSKEAHCVGYASFFVTSCNHLLEKYHLAGRWKARSRVGQLYFLGTNVHPYINTAFFRDHDFVTIENNATGQVIAVDPTVNDYLFIDFITYEK